MNQISELMRQRGMKLSRLAELTGIDAGHLSRMRKGERGINLKQARKIAEALGTTESEVLGIDVRNHAQLIPSNPPGFSDDWSAYSPGTDDPFRGFVGPNRYWVMVQTDAVSRVGPARGDLALVDDSAQGVQKMKPLAIVIGNYHSSDEPENGQNVLRQFVPPSLLITNGNDLSSMLDLERDDVQVLGVVVRFHRALGG